MKKIILVFILQITGLMAIDFTMVPGSLTPVSTQSVDESGDSTSETPLPTTKTTSTYLETVNIPAYDVNNPTHILITPTNGKWNESVLNNLNYKHFYIVPGKYSNSTVWLKTSGTENDRRTISLYNPSKPTDGTHPAALQDSEQANIKLSFNGASYWTIDRMSGLENSLNTDDYIISFTNKSHHNILNAVHHRGMVRGIVIYPGCNYNTIQKSYIHDSTHQGRLTDNVGIFLYGGDGSAGLETIGTKIIENDIKNLNDGVQLQRKHGSLNHVNFAGTIADGNRFWVDSAVYTNGDWSSNGYSNDPDSEFMVAENGFDVKDGSEDANNPVIVSNNIVWGYRETDKTTGQNDVPGKAVNISFTGCKNIVYDSNIVFDSEWGMYLVNLTGPASSIKNNIMYDIGNVTPPLSNYPNGRDTWVFRTPSSGSIEISNNSIIDTGVNASGAGRAIYVSSNNDVSHIKNSLLINTINIQGDTNQDIDNTWYYNHSGAKLGGSNEHEMGSADPKMGNYSFEYERYTSNPKTKTLIGIISTTSSSHYGKAGSSITVTDTNN